MAEELLAVVVKVDCREEYTRSEDELELGEA
jgi:hypothetical protein